MAFLARRLRADSDDGDAVGRILIDRIDVDFVLVDGTDGRRPAQGPGDLRRRAVPRRAGHDARSPVIARRTPRRFGGSTGSTRGDRVVVEMPYGRFTYEVEKTRIVAPTRGVGRSSA